MGEPNGLESCKTAEEGTKNGGSIHCIVTRELSLAEEEKEEEHKSQHYQGWREQNGGERKRQSNNSRIRNKERTIVPRLEGTKRRREKEAENSQPKKEKKMVGIFTILISRAKLASRRKQRGTEITTLPWMEGTKRRREKERRSLEEEGESVGL